MKLCVLFELWYAFLRIFQIISANVTTVGHEPVSLNEVETYPLAVKFTYSVLWTPTRLEFEVDFKLLFGLSSILGMQTNLCL